MVLSWIRRSWNERQAMQAEDLPAELSGALEWEGGTLAEHEQVPEDPTAAGSDAFAPAVDMAPTGETTDPETSDITDALRAVLQEAEALPDSAVIRLAATVDSVAAQELVSHVRGLRRRLDL
jgi:hypothetical protein